MKSSKKQSLKRPAWGEYFLNLTDVVGHRSNCLRQPVGAVLVQGTYIIATGYNGTPMNTKNCNEGGCERCAKRHDGLIKEYEDKELCVCVHAEQNALLQSAYHGVATQDTTLYSTLMPCLQCAKALINAGVKEVIYREDHYEKGHEDNLGKKLLKQAGIKVVHFSK